MKQNLSSLMDGELDDAASTQCIRALDADPELKAAWNEYHLIGDAIRGSALLSVDVRAEVGQALQQEPTVLAPKPKRGSGSGLMRYAMAASFALAGVAIGDSWLPQVAPDFHAWFHHTCAITAFLCVTTGMVLQAWRFRLDDRWRRRFPLAAMWSVACYALLWLHALWPPAGQGWVQKLLIALIVTAMLLALLPTAASAAYLPVPALPDATYW